MRSRPLIHEFQRAAALDEALHIIPGEFSSYLRGRGYALTTIDLYAGYLRAAARALAARRRSLLDLSFAEVAPLVARLNSSPGRAPIADDLPCGLASVGIISWGRRQRRFGRLGCRMAELDR